MTRVRVVILACAISAGIHGALAPEHFQEGTGAGTGFVAATVLLAALVVALAQGPTSRVALSGATFVLAGLIGSYALTVTAGLPALHPEVEPVDGLALFTKAIEAIGLAAAASLVWHRRLATLNPRPKGT